ncbi:protein of unknown function [Streptantibioticus cattleyicolor NRRL 8057 = DSM 46488]|nr:protein of unknown function [Streptantibioticus cattleyicolor NRRL 8057 = DSM 46488]
MTSGRFPVTQEASGQSSSSEQASKPRVMESPRAAIERGCGSHAVSAGAVEVAGPEAFGAERVAAGPAACCGRAAVLPQPARVNTAAAVVTAVNAAVAAVLGRLHGWRMVGSPRMTG